VVRPLPDTPTVMLEGSGSPWTPVWSLKSIRHTEWRCGSMPAISSSDGLITPTAPGSGSITPVTTCRRVGASLCDSELRFSRRNSAHTVQIAPSDGQTEAHSWSFRAEASTAIHAVPDEGREEAVERHVLTCVVVGVLVACTNESPTGPTRDPGGTCRLGPIHVVPIPAEGPCNVIPQCPRVRPATAETIIAVSTCGFGANASSCTPVQNPGCPRPLTERVRIHFRLANPDRPGSVCTADVFVGVEAIGNGGARALWDAQELEDAPGGGCRNVGPEYEGEATVVGACCERIIDIPLPAAQRTFRVVIRTDWQ
jgi:hypothetical protein